MQRADAASGCPVRTMPAQRLGVEFRPARVRWTHGRDADPRTRLAVARSCGRGIRRIRGWGRRAHRCTHRTRLEPVRGRRRTARRPRAGVGEGCRDRPVRHRRQGRAAHRHRPRGPRARRGGGRARDSLATVRAGAHRPLRRGRRGCSGDSRERVDARRRAVGSRRGRGGDRAAAARAAATRDEGGETSYAGRGRGRAYDAQRAAARAEADADADGRGGTNADAAGRCRAVRRHRPPRPLRPTARSAVRPRPRESTGGDSSAGRAARLCSARSRPSAATSCRGAPAR